MLDNAKGEVDEVWDSYNMGLITNNERYNQIVDIWSRVDTRMTETLILVNLPTTSRASTLCT